MNGNGNMSWIKGYSYTGQFIRDKKDGYGIFKWAGNS